MCVCSLRYPACNAHAPYCHPWPAPLYNIFPHYLTNGAILGGWGGVTEHKMCVLIFSTTFIWDTSRSTKYWARYEQKSILVFMYKEPVILDGLWLNLNFLDNVRKILKYEISRKSVQLEPGCYILTLLGSGHQKPARDLPVPNVQ